MNFKQNSLFTRNTGFDEEQADVQGGVLAVWGSPSSGKTTVSVKLADYLARKKKNVLFRIGAFCLENNVISNAEQ